jgi:inosine-uridine nucleoside N-ribohydrolase
LRVLAIGAITDVASAILRDPSITSRIRVLSMGFQGWPAGGDEFNIANDVKAMQVVPASDAPLVVGPGDVCRKLSLPLEGARAMVAGRGPVGDWLWTAFESCYYRYVKSNRSGRMTSRRSG